MTPLDRILAFLAEIGIAVHERPLSDSTFIPGIFIERGEIVIDRARLSYPGDLLHEAGHIAVVPPASRASLNDNLKSEPAEEIAAIAWSYAAARHIGIDPAIVFHPHGYKGGAQEILENFNAGRYFGVPMLAWLGLTRERPNELGSLVYPEMIRWLRAEPIDSPAKANAAG